MTPPRSEFRILSLAGGGYLGLYTASLLALLEAEAGEPIGRRFDLIAGTSVGGILALGAAFEIPMQRFAKLFIERGSTVFSRRALPTGKLGRLLDLGRSVLHPKYGNHELRKALAEEFGERTLVQADHPVIIPAVDTTQSVTKVFKTPHAPASRGDGHLRVVDIALATSAAPAYFPLVKIEERLYADGGLYAVAPDLVALHEAEHYMGVDIANVSMLSVGTAAANYRPSDHLDMDAGAVSWLSTGRLIMTMVSVQQQHAQAIMRDRLAERYLRLDAPWPEGAGLGIDVATREAAQTLVGLARETMDKLDRSALARFI